MGVVSFLGIFFSFAQGLFSLHWLAICERQFLTLLVFFLFLKQTWKTINNNIYNIDKSRTFFCWTCRRSNRAIRLKVDFLEGVPVRFRFLPERERESFVFFFYFLFFGESYMLVYEFQNTKCCPTRLVVNYDFFPLSLSLFSFALSLCIFIFFLALALPISITLLS